MNSARPSKRLAKRLPARDGFAKPERFCQFIALLIFVLVWPAQDLQAQTETANASQWAIAPVTEAQVQALLAPTDAAMRGWTLDSASIQPDRLEVGYRNGTTTLRLILRHRSQAKAGDRLTDTFAISPVTTVPPDLPPDFWDTLEKQIRKTESDWPWVRIATVQSGSTQSAENAPDEARGPPLAEAKPQSQSLLDEEVLRLLTPKVEFYLLAMLILGLGANAFAHRRFVFKRDPDSRRSVLLRDPAVWAILAAALAIRLALALSLPISNDEAAHIEPDFWAQWFGLFETRSSPPLFRYLIHLTERHPDPLWLMRLPVIVFGVASVYQLGVLLRPRTTRRATLVAMGFLTILSLQIFMSVDQKAYTLWLWLLLLQLASLLQAIAGSRRAWVFYAFWTALACMTHYLTPLYVAAQFAYILRYKRHDWRYAILAVFPGAMMLLPFVLPLIVLDRPLKIGAGLLSGGDWWLASMREVVWQAGLWLAIGLWAVVRKQNSRPSTSFSALALWMAAFGLIGTVAFGATSSIQTRTLFPVVPLMLIWAALQFGKSGQPQAPRLKWAIAILFGLTLLDTGAQIGADLLNSRRDFDAETLRTELSAPYVVVHPQGDFLALMYTLTGRRDLVNGHCESGKLLMITPRDNQWFMATPNATGSAEMTEIIKQLGRFDFVRSSVDSYTMNVAPDTAKSLARWLDTNCDSNQLDNSSRTEIWHCGTSPNTQFHLICDKNE